MFTRFRAIRAVTAALLVFGGAVSAQAQDAEALVKELQTRLGDLKAFTADMSMKMNMMGMSMEYGGDVAFLDKQFIMNITMDMMGQKFTTRSVMDKTGIMWSEVDMGGMKQVMKMDMKAMEEKSSEISGLPAAPGGFDGGNPVAAIEQMLSTFDVTLDGKDTIDGVEVYRLSAEVKEELKDKLDPSGQMAQMGVSPEFLKFAFGVEDGFPRQYTTLGTDGSVVMEMTFSNVNLKPDLDPAMFDYTPPEGVPVMDLMEMMEGGLGDPGAETAKFEAGSAAPAFTGTSLAGDEVSLSDYKGKVVLLDFWATWCGPCVQELPNVIDAYKAYHDKGFEIVAISLDESKDDLDAFLADHPDMTWVQLFDGKGWDSDIALQYEVEAIPFTLLLDREGNVVHEGLRGEALAEALAELLGE